MLGRWLPRLVVLAGVILTCLFLDSIKVRWRFIYLTSKRLMSMHNSTDGMFLTQTSSTP
jgi:hypothetical protein